MNNQRMIFDVGMHIGQDTACYLAKGFQVLAIKANPLLVRDVQSTLKMKSNLDS